MGKAAGNPAPKIIIARAAPGFSDWAGLRTCLVDAFRGMQGRIDPPSSLHRMAEADFARLASGGCLVLAQADDRLVGCAFGTPEGDALYLSKLAVLPPWQGQGLLRRMLEVMKTFATNQHLNRFILQTRIELTENHATFRALGFHVIEETRHPGYDRTTGLRFAKSLT
jgi:GNAT superfamily N-acetyltransferase